MSHPFQSLISDTTNFTLSGLRGASPAALAAETAKHGVSCVILPDDIQVQGFVSDLELFTKSQILTYPGQEIPPYTPLSPDQATTANRISALYRIKNLQQGIVVLAASSLWRCSLPEIVLNDAAEYIEAGEDFDQDDLIVKLTRMGYEKVALVQNVGDFSVRGGIIDLFPPPFQDNSGEIHTAPLRLDFFGDIIDSLRHFDPINQRSTGKISDATLLPVSEIIISEQRSECRRISRLFAETGESEDWQSEETHRLMEQSDQGLRFAGIEFFLPLYYHRQKLSTILDLLPENCRLIFCDPSAVNESINLGWERIETNFCSTKSERIPALPPAELFLGPAQIEGRLQRFSQIHLTDFPEQEEKTLKISSNNHLLLKQNISLNRAKLGLIAPLAEQIHSWHDDGGTVIVCCRSAKHTKNLAEMLDKHDFAIEIIDAPLNLDTLPKNSASNALYLCNHELSEGFSFNEYRLHFISESELFGEMRLGKRSQKRPKGEPIRFSELNEGDIVVHREHGLGIYLGLTTIEFLDIINDFMLIEYREGDKLYLPVDRLNLISRYQGLSDKEPRLDKLGSQAWKATTAKVKEEVWKVAQELLDIYAKRELKEGRQFSPPGALYQELEESFPFDETAGQMAAIADVITDLTGERPMDRLVCGDVGYGKTEVAIRGAFKVVEDGYQVALLVPTTVLAEQHAKTFTERLKGFPVKIACLNRFRSTSEQKTILKELEAGKIDIIIGTHRLLSKDVTFRKLGLVIIDEEHRFGVAHKEKLKKMRTEVDILTLTATPIPRTLQMSLLSIRDLSVISTPPEHRVPVKTFVTRFDELVIKEAVTRELRRGGQVFFVHNRVKSIHQIAARIQKLVPDAKIAVAHGQMDGKELEKIMVSFVAGEINVLVATTIVESGLDIPAANTIIINRADMLGLAEIYQLRGRVGRSSAQSFAYLLVPSIDHLSKESKDRLRALMDTSELGGGFKLAMSDLQIRGGGNLLGVSQSGNIAAIGYDLYLDLLQKTVADLKAQQTGEATGDDIEPEVKLQLSAYIPENYIPDISQRYLVYRRIAALANSADEDLVDLKDEMKDRYGTIPAETENLLRIITLKKELAKLRIAKIEQGPDNLIFNFLDNTPVSAEILLQFLARHPQTKKRKAAKITPDGRVVVYATLTSVEAVFAAIRDVLSEFMTFVEAA